MADSQPPSLPLQGQQPPQEQPSERQQQQQHVRPSASSKNTCILAFQALSSLIAIALIAIGLYKVMYSQLTVIGSFVAPESINGGGASAYPSTGVELEEWLHSYMSGKFDASHHRNGGASATDRRQRASADNGLGSLLYRLGQRVYCGMTSSCTYFSGSWDDAFDAHHGNGRAVQLRAVMLPNGAGGVDESRSPLIYLDMPEKGHHRRASYIRVGSKFLIVPPMEDIGLLKREMELVPVHNVSQEEMRHLTTGGRTFSEIFSVMRAYQTFTNRACMSMHELSGYAGHAKKLMGILVNDGQDYIHAVNPVIIGDTEDTQRVTYYSTLCPHTKWTEELAYGVVIRYTKFDSLVRNRIGGAGASTPDAARDRTEVSREWFYGKAAACLQVMAMEYAGINLCDGKKSIYDGKVNKDLDMVVDASVGDGGVIVEEVASSPPSQQQAQAAQGTGAGISH
jgi:hypothetical protein